MLLVSVLQCRRRLHKRSMLQFIIQLHELIRFVRLDIASAALVDRLTSPHNINFVRRFFSDPGRSVSGLSDEEAIGSFETVAKPLEKSGFWSVKPPSKHFLSNFRTFSKLIQVIVLDSSTAQLAGTRFIKSLLAIRRGLCKSLRFYSCYVTRLSNSSRRRLISWWE